MNARVGFIFSSREKRRMHTDMTTSKKQRDLIVILTLSALCIAGATKCRGGEIGDNFLHEPMSKSRYSFCGAYEVRNLELNQISFYHNTPNGIPTNFIGFLVAGTTVTNWTRVYVNKDDFMYWMNEVKPDKGRVDYFLFGIIGGMIFWLGRQLWDSIRDDCGEGAVHEKIRVLEERISSMKKGDE